MTDSSAQNSGKSTFRNWRYAVGWLLAAAGLIWVLRDIHPSKLAGELAGIDWRWVALALVFDVVSYVVQAVRWRLLLEPVGKIGLLRATQAIYAGLFTNEVLPMRPGEFVRSYLASRWMGASFVSILPSIIVERLFDGVWIAMGIGLAVAQRLVTSLSGVVWRRADTFCKRQVRITVAVKLQHDRIVR